MDTSDTASYLYDGHGRRVKRVNAKGTNYSFYDKAGRLIYREKADGKKVSYVFLAKLQVARIEDGLATYIHTDLLGSPVVESDASRTVLEGTRMHYRPFGQTIETPKDEVGYTGHKFDTDIGLVYAQQRYYDSEIGRFYADDPVDAVSFIAQGNVQGFGRYTYVNNNPYKYTDPDGRNHLLVARTSYALTTAAMATFGIRTAVVGLAIYNAVHGDEFGDNVLLQNIESESTVEELDPLHDDDTLGERPDLEALSDDELLDSVNNPSDSEDPGLVVNDKGKLMNGNSRARELKNRAKDPNSKIKEDTKVKVTVQKSNKNDYFWDL